MTKEEAIEILKSFINVYRICREDDDSPSVILIANDINAFKVAIKALEQEPCEDAISRQAVLDMMNYGILEDNIETLPSVTTQPKIGHWIVEVWNNKEHHTCSSCRHVVDYEPCYHYCPYCGAEMRWKNDTN